MSGAEGGMLEWSGEAFSISLAHCLSAEPGAQPEEAAVTQDAGCFVLALVSRNWIF